MLRQGYAGHGGFTLIEMLSVLAIIVILAGLLIAGTVVARKKARVARAQAEVKELAKAWKSYWMIYGKWPAGCSGNRVQMDAGKMKILAGTDVSDNTRALNFMDVDPKVLNNGFFDPWKKLYEVDFAAGVVSQGDSYEATVFFPQRKRYDY